MQKFNSLTLMGFTVLLWNCRSIKANLIDFKHYINSKELDIICLTETWCKITIKFKINNYKIFRSDRFDQRLGGVGILIKHSIKIVDNNFSYFNGGDLEAIIVSVIINIKIEIFALYTIPQSQFLLMNLNIILIWLVAIV